VQAGRPPPPLACAGEDENFASQRERRPSARNTFFNLDCSPNLFGLNTAPTFDTHFKSVRASIEWLNNAPGEREYQGHNNCTPAVSRIRSARNLPAAARCGNWPHCNESTGCASDGRPLYQVADGQGVPAEPARRFANLTASAW